MKKKLNLKDLEVQSFVTSSLNVAEETPGINGGTGQAYGCGGIGTPGAFGCGVSTQPVYDCILAARLLAEAAARAAAGGGAAGGGGAGGGILSGITIALSPAAIVGVSLIKCPYGFWEQMGGPDGDKVWNVIN